MASGSSYSAVKAALVAQLSARPGLQGVKVNYEAPNRPEDVKSDDGKFESISFDRAEGSLDNVLSCGPNLPFDETYELDLTIQVMRLDTTGVGPSPQQVVDERAEELLFEVLSELNSQSGWDLEAINLDQFAYITLIPISQVWEPGFLEGTTGGRGVTCRLGIEVSARRAFN